MPIVDLWHRTVKNPDGSKTKVRSAKYGRGKRWAARYRDNAGNQKNPTFTTKEAARQHLASVEGDLAKGQYVDPKAGKITFRAYADEWRSGAGHRESTARNTEQTLRRHVYPVLGERRLASIRPSHVQAWVTGLSDTLAPSTIGVTYAIVSTIFATAARDDVIGRTPCRNIRLPDAVARKHPVMTAEQVATVRAALPERYRGAIDLAAGSGLRQGELFGLEVRHVDFLRRVLVVEQQLTRTGTRPRVGAPKTSASYREIPLPARTVEALAAHMARYPPIEVTVLDATEAGEPRERVASFLFSTRKRSPVRASVWSEALSPAMRAAAMPQRSGLHSLRRWYASLLIRHGESVKVVQERMGHSSAATTMDTYAGLWPDNNDRTREAVEAGLAGLDDVRPMCAEQG